MKKALILLIAMLLAFQGIAVYAEGDAAGATGATGAAGAAGAVGTVDPDPEPTPAPIVYDYDELTVGTVTPFGGSFFTQMWGNVSSDLDVRLLLHGYNLIEWRSDTGVFAVDPSVVSGIVVSENGYGDRTYTLTLCDDLYYSDGTKITAWDYAFSMLLSIAPEVAEIGGSIRPTVYLTGYEDYINGVVPYMSGIRVTQDDTISFTVSHDYLPFFYELAVLDCMPYPISVIAPGCEVRDRGRGVYIINADVEEAPYEEEAAETGEEAGETAEDAEPEAPDWEPIFTAALLRQTILDPDTGYLTHPSVVSGPYTLVSFDGETVRLEINDYYKGNSDGQKPSIQRLVYTVVDNDTMLDKLASGEIGLLNKCVSADVLQSGTRMVAQSEGFSFSNYTRNGMSFISFCCENAPVDSVVVRQAIAMCMDKDGLTTDTVRNYGMRVDGYYGMGQWMYQLIDGTQAYPVEAPDENADQATIDAYEAEIAEWEALTLDDVRVYDLDVEEAARLLASEGWTLNRQGDPFDPDADDVRCKDVDGDIVPLELKLICPEGSSLNAGIPANFTDHLAEAGILLDIEEMPLPQLLQYYYRQEPRDCHMIMLATNFDIVFEPSANFLPDDGEENKLNPSAINDAELYALAVDMRRTEPDDVRGYCEKWIRFEERFQEIVPAIPLYSNVYFDFYPLVLHNYDISSNVTWSQAIVGAYMSDASDEELEGEDEEEQVSGILPPEDDFEIIG